MRKAGILLILLFSGCKAYEQLSGSYVYGNTMELRFTENPNRFEYFVRGEMGLLQYSAGEWRVDGNKVYLSGFNDGNRDSLRVGSAVADSGGGTQVVIAYSTDTVATYIKSVVVINGNVFYPITKDTVLVPVEKVASIQVKAYVESKGLLSGGPGRDTLYSQRMRFDGGKITLKFSVGSKDFVRTNLADTLIVGNKETLRFRGIKLKKSPGL